MTKTGEETQAKHGIVVRNRETVNRSTFNSSHQAKPDVLSFVTIPQIPMLGMMNPQVHYIALKEACTLLGVVEYLKVLAQLLLYKPKSYLVFLCSELLSPTSASLQFLVGMSIYWFIVLQVFSLEEIASDYSSHVFSWDTLGAHFVLCVVLRECLATSMVFVVVALLVVWWYAFSLFQIWYTFYRQTYCQNQDQKVTKLVNPFPSLAVIMVKGVPFFYFMYFGRLGLRRKKLLLLNIFIVCFTVGLGTVCVLFHWQAMKSPDRFKALDFMKCKNFMAYTFKAKFSFQLLA